MKNIRNKHQKDLRKFEMARQDGIIRHMTTGTYANNFYIEVKSRRVKITVPSNTAVPLLCGHTAQISSSVSPKRDCGSKGVNFFIEVKIWRAEYLLGTRYQGGQDSKEGREREGEEGEETASGRGRAGERERGREGGSVEGRRGTKQGEGKNEGKCAVWTT